MKSAYEIALGRLEKLSPTRKLSTEQKAAIAEIDNQYKAKVAERRLLLEDEIRKAQNDSTATEQLRKQLASEIARLQEECEAKKEEIRGSAS